ncbi:MAG TPA: proprotein convertase P-domain-containing protein, partial [Acidobacteriota bacterium]|nr:proprotein convertase P-domain-containing protein [Acidobacteriota bacterium]
MIHRIMFLGFVLFTMIVGFGTYFRSHSQAALQPAPSTIQPALTPAYLLQSNPLSTQSRPPSERFQEVQLAFLQSDGRLQERLAPGLERRVSGTLEQMEIEWTVTPGGNPSDIRLEFPAVERFEYTAEKSLILHLGDRHQIEVSDLKAQQMLPNQRVDVPARIEYLGESQIGITAGAYVTGEPLRISLRVKSDLELIKEYSSNATQPGSHSHTTEADRMVARPASAGKRGQFSGAATDVFTVDPVPDIAIPDNGYNGTLGSMASVTIDTSSLPVGSTVDDVTISIDLAHTFIGDLTIKLESPSGSVLGIVSRTGAVETADDGNDAAGFGENSNWGGSILFSDAGPVSAEQMGKVPADLTTIDTVCVTNGQCHYSPAPGSIATPPSTFAGFDGQNARGNWRLYVGDSAAADTGTLRSVTLTLTTSPSSTTVSSINTSGANPLCNTISGTTVTWDVTFAASVTGVTASNFSLVDVGNTLTGESISSVSGSGTAWTVTANTGTGAGTLRLDMANSTGITPTVTNVPFTGQTFTINAPATVNAGPDQTVCAGSAVTLAGIIGGSASNGTWSGGAGTFNPNNTTLNAVYTPSAGEVTAGTVTLTLTTDDPTGPCLAVSDTMTITINPAATVNAGADQTVCASSPAVTLAGIIGGSASNGTWSGGAGTFNP